MINYDEAENGTIIFKKQGTGAFASLETCNSVEAKLRRARLGTENRLYWNLTGPALKNESSRPMVGANFQSDVVREGPGVRQSDGSME